MAGPAVYTLTDLTGRKKNIGRTMIVSGIEVRRNTIIVASVSLIISLVPTFVVFWFVGVYAVVFVPAAFIGAGFFLLSKSRQGLQLSQYRALNDKRRADPNTFFICFRPTERQEGFARIVQSCEAANRTLRNVPTAVFTKSRRASGGKGKPA